MDSETPELTEDEAPKPAFHLRTISIALLWRLPVLLICLALGVVGAYLGGKKLGRKTFEAQTLMRYERHGEVKPETDEKTAILTLRDEVKIEKNMREVKERLNLKTTLEDLGKACEVVVQKNTTLLSITVKWDNPVIAADIANTLRDVFIEQYNKNTKESIHRQLTDSQRRLDKVRAQLKEADAFIQKFTSDNQVVDIDKQSRALLEESNSMSVLLEQAQADQKTIEEQAIKLDSVIQQLKQRVSREQKSNASLESLSDLSIRIGRVKDAIEADKSHRTGMAELRLREAEMESAQKLFDQGFISRRQYDRTAAALEQAQIATVDTEQTKAWRKELESLQARVIPNQGTMAPSAPILQQMLVRTFDIQLQRLAIIEKVRSLTMARQRVMTQLARMPLLQRQYDAYSRNITALETERKAIEERLSILTRAYEAQIADFSLLSPAQAEKDPTKSTTMLTAVGIGMIFVVMGLGLWIGPEVLFSGARSAPEAALRFGMPTLGAIPRRRRKAPLFPAAADTRLSEKMTEVAQRVRVEIPRKGARILIVSANPRENASRVAANLVACWGRQGERVAFLEMLPEGAERAELSPISPNPASEDFPLETYLTSNMMEEDIPIPKPVLLPELTGVSLLSRDGRNISPDSLGSTRMQKLYAEIAQSHNIVLTIAAPALERMDAKLLAKYADAVILVARSGKTNKAAVNKAVERLKSFGANVAGVILTDVSPLYMTVE